MAVGVTVMLLAPYAYFIPKAGLAGILMLSSWRLVDRKQLVYYLRTTRFDAWIVIITAISAVAVSVEFCVLIGVFMSFVLYVPQAARVRMTELIMTPEQVVRERHEEDVPCRRFAFLAWKGICFLGRRRSLSSCSMTWRMKWSQGGRVVILRLKRARNPDAVCMSGAGAVQ